MGNLVRKKEIFLVNTSDSDSLKLYDSNKKLQYNGPSGSKEGTGIVLDCEKIEYVLNACAATGSAKAQILTINPPCPCDLCDFEGGIVVENVPKMDGRTDRYQILGRYYGKFIPKVVCSGGYLDATNLALVKDGIVDAINADTKEGIVDAGNAIILDLWNAASACTIDGLAVTASATIAAFVAKINALGTTYHAYLDTTTPATSLWIINTGNSTDIAFVNTAGTIAQTDTTQYVGLVAKSNDVKFNVTAEVGFLTSLTVAVGGYGFLTNDEMAKLFPIQCWMAGMQPNLPTKDATYCKQAFRQIHRAYDLVGANHLNTYYEEVVFYVLKTVAEDANWNAKFNTWAAACGITGWTTWTT